MPHGEMLDVYQYILLGTSFSTKDNVCLAQIMPGPSTISWQMLKLQQQQQLNLT